MSEHKRKAGLQKEISSIFKGVSIRQNYGGQEPPGTPAPERTDLTEPKQPAPELQKSEALKAYQATQLLPKAAPEHTVYAEPKPPTQEPQKTQAPKAHQATQTLLKASPAQQLKVVPAQQPKVVPAQQPKSMPAQQPKVEPAQQPKSMPAQQPKALPVRQPKADIDKNVSKKRTTVTISSQSFLQQIKDKLFKPKPGVSTAKQKAMVVMMPLLFIVLIFMMFRGGVFGTSVPHTEAPAEDTAPSVVTAGSNTKIDWELPAPYPTTLRDPMRLVPAATAQTDETETRKMIKLIVKSILYSEDNPSAVIGSRIVHEGEKIQNVSVIKINTDSVEFEMNGKRWTQMVQR